MPHAPRPPRAFSLIELIVAITILSIGLVAAMRIFPVGLRASHRAELDSRAAIIAQRTIESLKLQAVSALTLGETTLQEDAFQVTTRIDQPSVEFLVDSHEVRSVEVTVAWEQNGRTRQLIFLTYLVDAAS